MEKHLIQFSIVLEKYNFVNDFIGMIKILYNDPIFKVKTIVG